MKKLFNDDKLKKYYFVIPILIIGITLLILRHNFLQILVDVLQLGPIKERNYESYNSLLQITIFSIYFYYSFLIFRKKKYYRLTGRNLDYDKSKFKRPYGRLLEYFRYENCNPHLLNTDMFPKIHWKKANGIVLGKTKDGRLITIPGDKLESNIDVNGPPGSGKTSGLAIINAMQFDGSVLAIDIKGDIFNYVSKNSDRTIIRFAPDLPDALEVSAHFDPLNGINEMSPTDKKLYIENMAAIIIPDTGGTDGGYFTSSARKYFCAITHLLLAENPDVDFPTIVQRILNGNPFDWVYAAIDSGNREAASYIASFEGNNEKNISSVYDTLTSAVNPFNNEILDVLLNKEQSISIKDLEEGKDIYLQIAQEHLDAYAPIFTLIVQSFSSAFSAREDMTSGKKLRPILFILDEFPQLTFSYQLINSNLSTLRSKKIVTTLIHQNYSQLEHRYHTTGYRTILGNCNYQIILGSNDYETSKAFSDKIGKKRVLQISNSDPSDKNKSGSRTVSEATEPVYPPEEISDLKNESIIYFAGKHVKCQKLNCYID